MINILVFLEVLGKNILVFLEVLGKNILVFLEMVIISNYKITIYNNYIFYIYKFSVKLV